MKLIWSWPRGGMSWFLWGWRPDVFADTRFWRLGPLTLMVLDVSRTEHAPGKIEYCTICRRGLIRRLYRAAAREWRLAALERGYGWS